MSDFTIDCIGDVVVGDEVEFTEGVFGGSFRKPRFIGERTIRARVEKDSYGAGKQQHTFTLLVLAADGMDAPTAGAVILRKGRNVYRNGCARAAWANEADRVLARAEKHERGGRAREDRAARRDEEGYYSR